MNELINTIKNEVCKGCNLSKCNNEVCAGECLPVEVAIEKNLNGRGLCDNVNGYIEKLNGSEK